jgi:hypothetical protein
MSEPGGGGARAFGTSVLLDGEAPDHWQLTTELPILIVVGVTGVGKSTTIAALARRLSCFVLPDRRDVADQVVFPAVQDELGEPHRPVRDRLQRFRLTARYRERNPGGLAHALSRLRVDPDVITGRQVVFDGLRGLDEIRWAIDHLPRTRFLGLRAPESVRLLRLLGRGEGFDYAAVGAPAGGGRDASSLIDAVPGLEEVVPAEELTALLASPALREAPLEEIAAKAAILVEEARNYDPAAALHALEAELGPWRRLILNTAVAGPEEVASQVARWLE